MMGIVSECRFRSFLGMSNGRSALIIHMSWFGPFCSIFVQGVRFFVKLWFASYKWVQHR